MPGVKPLPTLLDICLKKFGRHCIKSLIENASVKYHEESAELHQERDLLLSEAKQFIHAYMILSIRDELLKFVLDEILCLRLNSFEVIWQEVENEEVLWKVIRDFLVILGGKGIQKLDLNYGVDNLEKILCPTVFQDMVWASNLVTIKLPNVWSAEIVEKIGRHCQNLQHLDLTFSQAFSQDLTQPRYSAPLPGDPRIACLGCLYGLVCTDLGFVKGSAGCPRLKTLVIPRWGECIEVVDHIVRMMNFMPNLHAVKNIDTGVVNDRYTSKFGKLSCTRWTEYEDWVSTSYSKCIYPNVRRFASWCRRYIQSHSLHANEGLTTVQELFPNVEVIEFNVFYFNWFDNIICMPSVKVLKLVLADETVGIGEINTVSKIFPNLEKLYIYTACYVGSDFEEDLRKNTFFQKLHTLQLNEVVEIDVNFLKILLEKSPAMKTLEVYCPNSSIFYLGEDACITDEFVEELSPVMKNLEKVVFAEDCGEVQEHLRLTYSSVRTILSSCPNIKCLGNIREWKLTDEDVSSLVSCITKNNWNLDLI